MPKDRPNPNPLVTRLNDIADAVLGNSELKVGPRTVADVLVEAARYIAARDPGSQLGGKRQYVWTAEEDQIIRDNFPDIAACLEKLGERRTGSAVYGRARKLGCTKSAVAS